MSTEDLEKYETEMELQLYREYRDIVRQFTYVVETERRFYLANSVDLQVREAGGEVYYELKLSDAWVWDMYRPARFVRNVRVLTFKDVNGEGLDKPDPEPPPPRIPPGRAAFSRRICARVRSGPRPSRSTTSGVVRSLSDVA